MSRNHLINNPISFLGRNVVSEIFKRWDAAFIPVEVSGPNAAATAFLISNLIAHTNQRFALIVPNEDEAEKFVRDIRSFLQFQGQEQHLSSVDLIPGWEHSPYREFNPSIKARIKRIKTYFKILDNQLRCLVCDPESFSRLCPAPADLLKRKFKLSVSDVITREELIEKLHYAGYTRSDPVEDPGQYSIRGALIDIFSPAFKKPYRIEFFDDLLETIRTFDPISQKSDSLDAHGKSIQELTCYPVTEWAFDAASIEKAKSNIKSFSDDHGISKATRDELFEKLDLGIKEPTLDYLAPYFSTEPHVSLLNYFSGSNWNFSIYDSLTTLPQHDRFLQSLKTSYEEAIHSGKIVCPQDKLYLSSEDFHASFIQKSSLQFERIALGVEALEKEDFSEDKNDVPELTSKLKLQCIENKDFIAKANSADGNSTAQKPNLKAILDKAAHWRKNNFTTILVSSSSVQSERIKYLLSQQEFTSAIVEKIDPENTQTFQIIEGQVSSGFRLPESKTVFLTDSEIFGPKKAAAKSSKGIAAPKEMNLESFIPSLEQLNVDEYIVHTQHGIGRYKGLMKLQVDQVWSDFLLLEYAGADKLYLPVYRLDLIQRYVGAEAQVPLDKLGSQNFEKLKQKVKAELQDLASKLLDLYAKRAMREGFSYSPTDEVYQEFEAKFPYAETPDQMKAIESVLEDMQSPKIMDRLVCGDVGYGKTEVAIRAAVKAVLDGKQVAVLVPTTVLALQHERSFTERVKDVALPIKVGSLSRFKTNKEIKETLQELKEGKVDIVVGTHRLLSKDVEFKDLGLFIVDEEQRFGVEHKEKLKNMKLNCDVLTLTATPIPRTLNFALMGLRDISVINTAPVDRLSVRTYVSHFDENTIKNAISQEISRGGQVFFIHNRVQSIHAMADKIQSIVPDAKIIIAHGQLAEKDLEERMLEFYNKKGNVLLCSTIIESGLDIPSANTIIINRADCFGLSQLYQLRGRVGRSQVRAYCYLMISPEATLTEDAKKRLEVITKFVDLGSGFKISSHDLEIRGGGDFLGKSQTGHIAAVGFEMFTELLDETIRDIKGQPQIDKFDPEIKLPVSALIPESFIPEVHQRLGYYKNLSQSDTPEELHEIELLLVDRYGKLPEEVRNLMWLIRIKQVLRKYHVKSLVSGKERCSIDASGAPLFNTEKVLSLVKKQPNQFTITPESKIIMKKPFSSAENLFQEVHQFFMKVT